MQQLCPFYLLKLQNYPFVLIFVQKSMKYYLLKYKSYQSVLTYFVLGRINVLQIACLFAVDSFPLLHQH